MYQSYLIIIINEFKLILLPIFLKSKNHLLFLIDYLSQKLAILSFKLNYLHILHIITASQYFKFNYCFIFRNFFLFKKFKADLIIFLVLN